MLLILKEKFRFLFILDFNLYFPGPGKFLSGTYSIYPMNLHLFLENPKVNFFWETFLEIFPKSILYLFGAGIPFPVYVKSYFLPFPKEHALLFL